MTLQTSEKESNRTDGGPPRHVATDLTQGHPTAEIMLGDQVYRLRITKAGKLILTK
ncbi:hemin uptake protein HemP [Sedimentitalea arenosa]|uniref:Hemin uptake protein HemP n=1 Tax=Sedimentitalea arenosa TaxID=2798803 RepID=A0A8J7JIN9_9RHOB|nr:hemin uptake protein HemP [Arenibacterium arenosum]MBJ6372814.1 hemin uptake protein HemP [Arenibacterium arenosum]